MFRIVALMLVTDSGNVLSPVSKIILTNITVGPCSRKQCQNLMKKIDILSLKLASLHLFQFGRVTKWWFRKPLTRLKSKSVPKGFLKCEDELLDHIEGDIGIFHTKLCSKLKPSTWRLQAYTFSIICSGCYAALVSRHTAVLQREIRTFFITFNRNASFQF